MTDFEKIELAMYRELAHQQKQNPQDLSAINILDGILKQFERIVRDHRKAEFDAELSQRVGA